MKIFLSIFLSLFIAGTVYSQKRFDLNYDWELSPKCHVVSGEDATYPAVMIKHFRILEYRPGTLESYQTDHQIIHLNTDTGIEEYNKVYIPLSGKELVKLSVRSVAPDGRITQMPKESLKELKNINGYESYKIFAIEGITVGGELEVLYTIRGQFNSFGRDFLQHPIPAWEEESAILYPKHRIFETKAYNGLNNAVERLFDTDRDVLSFTAKKVPAMTEEPFSAYRQSMLRYEFRLESGKKRTIVDWDKIALHYANICFQPGGASVIKGWMNDIQVNGQSDLEKIHFIENYIKTNFNIKQESNEAYRNVGQITTTRVADQIGIVRLFVGCLDYLQIPNQLVFASTRADGLIDPEFESPLPLRRVLIYLPQFDKYLAPEEFGLRVGAPPEEVGNGLFVDYKILHFVTNSAPSVEVKKYEIKSIALPDYTHNDIGIKATVLFNDGIENPAVAQENSYKGYRAFHNRYIYAKAQPDKKKEALKLLALSSIENPTIDQQKVEGEDVNLSADENSVFNVYTDYHAPSLVEKAGEDILFHVGQITGKQSELYQEKERKTDIEFPSARNYHHEITVSIPKGYACSGLEAARIQKAVTLDGNTVMEFKSDYTLTPGELVLKISETYKISQLKKEKYQEFRSVINASADFNKMIIVLQPIK